ncbi:unnamed protein product, partial [Brenthis ino]
MQLLRAHSFTMGGEGAHAGCRGQGGRGKGGELKGTSKRAPARISSGVLRPARRPMLGHDGRSRRYTTGGPEWPTITTATMP